MSSNFENLPLPVTKDSQDYVRLIPAGQTVEIPVVGDFIYCKFSDGEIRVVINGKSTSMESGDERRSGDGTVFRGVNLINETAVDKAVVFVIGFGSFNRRIVQGNVSIEPILRSADGTTRADTRQTISVNLLPANLSVTSYLQGDTIIASRSTDEQNPFTMFPGESGNLVIACNEPTGDVTFDEYSLKDLSYLGSLGSYEDGPGGTFEDVCFWPGVGLIQVSSAIGEKGAVILLNGTDRSEDYVKLFTTILSDENKAPQTMTVDVNTGNLVLMTSRNTGTDNSLIQIYDRDFNLVQRFDNVSRFWSGLASDPITGNLVISDNRALRFYSMPDFEFIEEFSPGVSRPFEKDFYVKGGVVYQAENLGDTVVALAVRDFTTKPEFIAVRGGCELKQAVSKNSELPQTLADITVNELTSGVEIRGNLIRAALEFYYRRAAPDDYLDHVYGLDYTRDAAGLPIKAISTGNRTFLASGVADEFDTLLPGQIILIIDNDLTLGGSL
jgi:hypothetical protein